MATPWEPQAGPSRPTYPSHATYQTQLKQLPPPPPSKSPSPAMSPNMDGGSDGVWNTAVSMTMPEPRIGGSSANGNGNSHSYPANGGDDKDNARRNPLVDLIDSEKGYVEQLGLVIRKVAAAWSRKDFPPPKLDTMFRCVEAVYKANRSFGQKLKEIGPNPSSPKALGDLLMRWIDDLEPSYHRYSTSFMTGFDSYTLVTKNVLLPGILLEISKVTPPPQPLTQWTLDALFLLPYTRLRYYRKLYARLLRSTKEGRSDHRLLVVANQRLETLVGEVEGRLEIDVAEEESEVNSVSGVVAGAGVGSGGGRESRSGSGQGSREQSWAEKERQSRTSSAMDSSLDSHSGFSPFNSRVEDPRNSGGSAATSLTQSSPQRPPVIKVPSMSTAPSGLTPTTATAPLSDLELRIDPERTIDLFTMTPKKCKLQMSPPTLPFTRSLRSSHDVTIYFTPTSTGIPVVHKRAHVFILSDLFLVADRMEAVDKAMKAQQVAREEPERVGEGGPMPEMWLSYPPLAGKHLMVAEGTQANVLNVMIMRKETFVIHAESDMARDQMMKDLFDCVDFAASATRKTTNPSQLPSPNTFDARSPSSQSDTRSGESVFAPLRYPSPFSSQSSPTTSPRPTETSDTLPVPISAQMNKLSLEPGESLRWPSGPSPTSFQPPPIPSSETIAVLPPRGASLRTRIPTAPSGSAFSNISPATSEPVFNGTGNGASLPRSASGRSVQSSPQPPRPEQDLPPVPQIRGPGSHLSDSGYPPFRDGPTRSRSAEPLRPLAPPSARFSSFPMRTGSPSAGGTQFEEDDNNDDISPPMSPVEEEVSSISGPTTISAQMKCKVFLKQNHQQWKSLGSGRLKLYVQQGKINVKQLVVEADSSSKAMLISTIVLTDGVERVAKTGVAVEISDKGMRTGIIYMIQLRNENSAMGLFESLLAGSDRAVGR